MTMHPADRYVASIVGRATALVLLGLLLLSVAWRIVEEGHEIGWRVAVELEFLLLPATIHEYTQFIALCGAMLGLASLAQHNELIALRAGGHSALRIAVAALLPGLLLSAVAVALAFEAVPWSLRQAAQMGAGVQLATPQLWRTAAGDYLQIDELSADGSELSGFTLYQLNAGHRLQTLKRAGRGRWENGVWLLPGAHELSVAEDDDGAVQLQQRELDELRLTGLPTPDNLLSAALPPAQLPLFARWREAESLSRYGTHIGARHWLSCWRSLLIPLSTIGLVALIAAMLIGAGRNASIALRTGGGILIGVLFSYLQNLGGTASVALDFSPFAGVAVVPLLSLIASLWLLDRRV